MSLPHFSRLILRQSMNSVAIKCSYLKNTNKCLKPCQRLMRPTFSLRSSSTETVTLNDELQREKTFQELLDESPLMQFGRAPGKCVIGKIVNVCNDDLYIDFGAKFEAVVKRPERNQDFFKIGATVRMILNKFEMTGSFLGDERHITLCEADAVLLGPYSDSGKTKKN